MRSVFNKMAATVIQTDKLDLAPGRIGSGVHARVAMAPGEVCGYLSGKLIHFEESVSPEGSNSVQVGPDLYILPKFPVLYINHSCNPNAGLSHDLSLIAIRDIHPGEELFIDYSTTMFERHFTMDCLCDEPNCRGTIEDFDLLPDQLQQHYIELGIVQSFISERFGYQGEQRGSGLVEAINLELGVESIGKRGGNEPLRSDRKPAIANQLQVQAETGSPVNRLK